MGRQLPADEPNLNQQSLSVHPGVLVPKQTNDTQLLNDLSLLRTGIRIDEERAFQEFAAQPESEKLLYGKIAPQIFGHEDIKKAIACLLFAGSRKRMPDGTKLR